MENVIIVIFENEASTYQVLSDLKNRSGNSTVLSAGIVQNIGGSIVQKDGWTNGSDMSSWASGGLIGGLVGILGGPIGMLFGASLGMLVGSVMDAGDVSDQTGVIEKMTHELKEGYLALITIAQEDDVSELDRFFEHYGTKAVIRRDVSSVQAEVYQAEEAQKELAKQARKKMREEKKEEWHKKAETVQTDIKNDFEKFKKDIKS